MGPRYTHILAMLTALCAVAAVVTGALLTSANALPIMNLAIWKGLHRGIWGEMYTLLDLHPDGTFDVEYVDYGWTPVTPPATAPTTA